MPARTQLPSVQTTHDYESIAFDPVEALELLPFRPGRVEGVLWKPLAVHRDGRGWLGEMFRHDEMAADLHPAMAYISETLPGKTRGPHEHLQQTDVFCFVGTARFQLYLWDHRQESPTFLCHEIAVLKAGQPMTVVVPPGVA